MQMTVTWGQALQVRVINTPGGLRGAVDQIHSVVGSYVGTRTTFMKIMQVDDPTELGARDAWRAWLLLTALGLNPAEWGITGAVAPPMIDPGLVAQALCARRDSDPRPSDYKFAVPALGLAA